MVLPETSEKRSYDAVVAGAGVIGLSCAWALAERGARVVVLDRGAPPAGATRVAAGMLAPVGELEFGERKLLDLTLEAARSYRAWAERLEAASGVATGYARTGALHVALDRDEAAELRRHHDLQRSLGLEAEWLGPRACRRLEPGLSPSLSGGVEVPGEAAVDPRALTQALLAALERLGVEVRGGAAVSEGLFAGGRLRGVRTEDGEEFEAPHTVLATGCWGADWLPAEAQPQVRPVKGQILELRGTEPVCERIVASERVYLVPREDGRLIVGATVEERGFDTAVTAGGVHELLREAYRLLPEVSELELVEAAAGLRPATPDNLPLVGEGAVEGLVLATGHYRNGILLAPTAGERVAEVVAGPLRGAAGDRAAAGVSA